MSPQVDLVQICSHKDEQIILKEPQIAWGRGIKGGSTSFRKTFVEAGHPWIDPPDVNSNSSRWRSISLKDVMQHSEGTHRNTNWKKFFFLAAMKESFAVSVRFSRPNQYNEVTWCSITNNVSGRLSSVFPPDSLFVVHDATGGNGGITVEIESPFIWPRWVWQATDGSLPRSLASRQQWVESLFLSRT